MINERKYLEMPEPQMMHLNRNPICALWIETTGNNPLVHEIIQICVWLLDNYLEPSMNVAPFYNDIQPLDPESVDFDTANLSKEKLIQTCVNGIDPYLAADYFEEWFQKLNAPNGKGIVPLTHNWAEKRPFLYKWLGHHTFNYIFNLEYRDVMTFADISNDRNNMRAEPYFYPKPFLLSYIANQHGLETGTRDGIEEKCIHLARLYQCMLRHRF